MPSGGVPQSLKYAVLSDAGNKLRPDPFNRQCGDDLLRHLQGVWQEHASR